VGGRCGEVEVAQTIYTHVSKCKSNKIKEKKKKNSLFFLIILLSGIRRKLAIELPYDAVIPLLGTYPKNVKQDKVESPVL
jgi:hypothetical protein